MVTPRPPGFRWLMFGPLTFGQSRHGPGVRTGIAEGLAMKLLARLVMGLVLPTCLALLGFAVARFFIGRAFEAAKSVLDPARLLNPRGLAD